MHSNRLRFTSSVQILEIKKDIKIQEKEGQDGRLDMTTFLKYSTKATERGVSDVFPDYLREKIITLKPTKSSRYSGIKI